MLAPAPVCQHCFGVQLLLDIGTGYGTSALALAFARDVRVMAFDEYGPRCFIPALLCVNTSSC